MKFLWPTLLHRFDMIFNFSICFANLFKKNLRYGYFVLENYDAKSAYDGYLTEDNKLRKHARIMSGILERHREKKLQEIEKNCQSTISARGINFRVYAANNRAEEKKWPLDIIPRIIPKTQWNKVTKGLKQRVKALNLFIDDVYNQKKFLKIILYLEKLFLTHLIM